MQAVIQLVKSVGASIVAEAVESTAQADILRAMGFSRVRLMTNNPDKTTALESYGVNVTERLPLLIEPNPDSLRYLQTKASRMGHDLPGLSQAGDQA